MDIEKVGKTERQLLIEEIAKKIEEDLSTGVVKICENNYQYASITASSTGYDIRNSRNEVIKKVPSSWTPMDFANYIATRWW